MSTFTAPDRATHAHPAHHTNGHGHSSVNGSGSPRRKRRNLLVPALIAFGVLGLGGAAGAVYYMSDRTTVDANSLSIFEARRGPLVVSVTESGTIKAAEQVVLKSEVEGRVGILWIIPEGQKVQKGDLLVELDTTELADEQVDREIAVQNAEAEYIQAVENLAVVENQAEADVATATLDYQFAQEDLTKYEEGDFPQLLLEAESKITISDEELTRALQKFQGSEALYKNNFISQTELDADKLAAQKAKLDLDLAKSALALLNNWEKKRQLDEFKANVKQTEMALERATRKASADVIQAEAQLRATKAEYDREKDRLRKQIDQIAKGKIYAPSDGLVVYGTSNEGGYRGNDEPLKAGREVREREDLIYLPTATDRIADVKVHESALDKVRLGLPARVTIDALPGREFWGTVTKVSPLPDATMSWLNPDLKVYQTEVRITGEHEELRTGMSSRTEIIIETYDDVVYVPVQSVVRVSGVPTVFVVRPGQAPEQREVEIGLDNNTMVVVTTGLEAGEQVMLAPPLGDTGAAQTLRMEDVPDDKRDQADDARENNPAIVPADDEGEPAADGGAGEGAQGAGEGRQRGGGNAAMGKLMQDIAAKATEEEQTKLREFFQNRDMAGGQAYLKELGEKYDIPIPEMPAMGAGQGGQRSGEDAEGGRRDGADREPDAAAPANESTSEPAQSAPAGEQGGK